MTDPISVLIEKPGVLAIISATKGPAYRSVGTMMACFPMGQRIGSLSSGCIEADISRHAEAAFDSKTPQRVRYGAGSPFRDIDLPCGGSMEVLLLPSPDTQALNEILDRRKSRKAFCIRINTQSGRLSLQDTGQSGLKGQTLTILERPQLQILAVGKGSEVSTFARLCHLAPFPTRIISPDEETLKQARDCGCRTTHIVSANLPANHSIDADTAVVLFFHDHEWEPPILADILKTDAFYIGAQGSQLARKNRDVELASLGIKHSDIARVKGPVGLIPSARDPKTLAISVLAEVLSEHRNLSATMSQSQEVWAK